MLLKKNSRPVWFDATIIVALGMLDVTYDGRKWRDPCCQVHGWNGAGEVVPEPFLMRRPPGGDPRTTHSNGRVIHQPDCPEFWVPLGHSKY